MILIEACEESGSYDLPFYVDHLQARIGNPSLVVCLDSGCANYDQLWLTTSLRGMVAATLTVRVLTEGVHSGDASGIVPSSSRILRMLVSRLEDEATGVIRPQDLYVQVPPERIAQAKVAAKALGEEVHAKFPFTSGMTPVTQDIVELVLNRTWRPQLATIGMDGLPTPGNAGNVLRPYTSARLSLRLPPTLDAEEAEAAVKALLLADAPLWRDDRVRGRTGGDRLERPGARPLARAVAGRGLGGHLRRPAGLYGRGRLHPLHGDAGGEIPHAQFVVTGVLGPHTNAHGPNEFLHIPTAKRVTAVVARVLADHGAANQEKKAA